MIKSICKNIVKKKTYVETSKQVLHNKKLLHKTNNFIVPEIVMNKIKSENLSYHMFYPTIDYALNLPDKYSKPNNTAP
jgi:hypothetical protein